MGKTNTGSWMAKQPRQTWPPIGVQHLSEEIRGRPGASATVIGRLCLPCATKRGITAETPCWMDLDAEDGNLRYDHCDDCKVCLDTFVPLTCPNCGNTECFVACAQSFVHVGPTWQPHGEPWLASDWEDLYDSTIMCNRCKHEAEREDFMPKYGDDRDNV